MAGKLNFAVPRGFDYITRQMSKMFDKSTTGVNVLVDSHHEIHDGDAYLMSESYDLSVNDVLDIRITTPDTTKWAHFVPEFDTESEFQVWLYEVATIETVGTAFTPINSNRNSPNTSGLVFDVISNTSLANANADTDVSGATTLSHAFTGAGKKEGGGSTDRREIMLKQNTIYSFRASATAAGWLHIDFNWYESVSKNI